MSGIAEGLTNVINAVKTGIDAVLSIPEKIVEGLKTLFIPEEGFFRAELDALVEEFSFFYSIQDTFNYITDFVGGLDGEAAPEITIPFSKLTKYKMKDYTLSFDWYAPYKQYVDLALGGFMLLGFVVKMWKYVPNIISGVSGSGSSGKESGGEE